MKNIKMIFLTSGFYYKILTSFFLLYIGDMDL